MEYKKLSLTFEEIFNKLSLREFVIIHIKETMEPKIIHPETKTIFDIPDGYLEYDKKHYFRKI